MIRAERRKPPVIAPFARMLELRDILRPGITGCVSRIPRMTEEVIADWRSQVHGIARRLQARRHDEQPVAVARNFRSIELERPKPRRSFHILLHAVLPYVAVAYRVEWNANEYGDEGGLGGFFGPPFVQLPAALLNELFTLEQWMVPLIDKGAVSDIKYWKPRRVGDFVFNYYD